MRGQMEIGFLDGQFRPFLLQLLDGGQDTLYPLAGFRMGGKDKDVHRLFLGGEGP